MKKAIIADILAFISIYLITEKNIYIYIYLLDLEICLLVVSFTIQTKPSNQQIGAYFLYINKYLHCKIYKQYYII